MGGWFATGRVLPEWVLVPDPDSERGMLEVLGKDIPSYLRFDYSQAIQFWARYRRYGVRDWQKLTVPQDRVIQLLDGLQARREREHDRR